MPFLNQMFYNWILTTAIIAFVSLSTNENDDDEKAIKTTAQTFKTTGGFAIGAYAIMLIVVAIYSALWSVELGWAF